MDTFPYDSWAEAIEAADGTTGYFTFGPGGNTAIVIITIIGIAMSVFWLAEVTMNESKTLNAEADGLRSKWEN